MKKSKAAWVLFILFTTARSLAETITFTTVNWQPFYGEDLTQNGFCVEIARQALARQGHTLEIEFWPWARAVKDAKTGRYHGLFGTWKNEDIADDYYFSEEILGHGDGHFLTLSDYPFHDIHLAYLKGKTVGFVRGYPVSDELLALFASGEVEKHEVRTVVQLIKLLRSGRIDFILENELVAKYHHDTSWPNKAFDLKVAGKDLVDGGLYIGWSKQKPSNINLSREFDEIIREMRRDGTIAQIMKDFDVN